MVSLIALTLIMHSLSPKEILEFAELETKPDKLCTDTNQPAGMLMKRDDST